ncbi:unnamed protein product [Urochloa humidicola]
MWPAGGEHPMAMVHNPAAAPPSSGGARLPAPPHTPYQSPVPYLFGGLAAMLGLIALSLLALACSYWKLSGSLIAAGEPSEGAERRRGDGNKAAAAGEDGLAGDRWREHVVVIMAGDERPTFLATPASGWGADADGVGCGGGSEEGRCLECGARSRPAGDDVMSRSEQSGVISGSSVISER